MMPFSVVLLHKLFVSISLNNQNVTEDSVEEKEREKITLTATLSLFNHQVYRLCVSSTVFLFITFRIDTRCTQQPNIILFITLANDLQTK